MKDKDTTEKGSCALRAFRDMRMACSPSGACASDGNCWTHSDPLICTNCQERPVTHYDPELDSGYCADCAVTVDEPLVVGLLD